MPVLIDSGDVYVSDPTVILAAGGTIAASTTTADVTLTFPASPVWQQVIYNVAVDEASIATNVSIEVAVAVNGTDFTSFQNVGSASFLGDFPPSGNQTNLQVALGIDGLIPGTSLIRVHLVNNEPSIATMAKATLQFERPLILSGT